MDNNFEYLSHSLINKEVKSEKNKDGDNESPMDEETSENIVNFIDNIVNNFTAEADNSNQIQNNEEMVTSCANTNNLTVENSGQSVSTPKPRTTISNPSPVIIMPTISKDGKLMPNHRTIYLIKTTSPNTTLPGGSAPTAGQVLLINNNQHIKGPVSGSATTGQVVVRSEDTVKMPSLPRGKSYKPIVVKSVGSLSQKQMINPGQMKDSRSVAITSQPSPSSQKDQVHATGDPSTSVSQTTTKVYKCPVQRCGNYSSKEVQVRQHVTQFHKIACTTPIKQVEMVIKKQDVPQNTNRPSNVWPQLYRCTESGCDVTLKDKSSINQHLIKDHNVVHRASTGGVGYPITKELVDHYIEAKQKEHFIPNSCFGKSKPVGAQARELVINLKLYFMLRHPEWRVKKLMDEICEATKLNFKTVQRIIYSFKKHKKIVGPKQARSRSKVFVCTDEDRDMILQCMYKLKDENRLKAVHDVYYEMMKNDQFNPSFKGCQSSTFYRLFAKTGLKIGERLISNRKPELIAKEKGYGISPLKSASGLWECDWPGCDKKFKLRENMVEHIRCHTDDKPYECIFPKCRYKCRTGANINKSLAMS